MPEGHTGGDNPSLYSLKMKGIDGKEIDFSGYKGKMLLIVNTASRCGYTPQYAELQQLHEKYGDKVTILGFPANDFAFQEPGSNSDIQGFCTKNYGVTFQMFEKSEVTGKDKNALYKWLSDKQANGWNDKEPSWNFCKYLVDGNGKLLYFFPSNVSPLAKEIVDVINR
jgi:glutathione peroxidase